MSDQQPVTVHKLLLRIDEAAAALGLSSATIYRTAASIARFVDTLERAR